MENNFEESTYLLNNSLPALVKITNPYSRIHGWLSLFICSFGTLFNILNIFILHKTKISTSTTNNILILIAISDSIIMLIYIPFCVHYYIINSVSYLSEPNPKRDTLFWTSFSIINTFISITLHCISIWLTVYLACYRYITLGKLVNPLKKNLFKKSTSTKSKLIEDILAKDNLIIALLILFCIIICIPVYLFPSIQQDVFNKTSEVNIGNLSVFEYETNNETMYVYYLAQSYLNLISNGFVFKASLYLQAIFGKIIPCFLLVIFISFLVDILLVIRQNRKKFNTFRNVSRFFTKKTIF